MKIRNKQTGQVFEVMAGTLYPDFFEEVKDDEIKVGEPKVEFEIEKPKEAPVLTKKSKSVKTGKKVVSKKETTTKKKGAKKNATSKK